MTEAQPLAFGNVATSPARDVEDTSRYWGMCSCRVVWAATRLADSQLKRNALTTLEPAKIDATVTPSVVQTQQISC